MTSTAFSKGLLLFIFCLLAGGGCLNFTPEEQTLETLQSAVRQRMLKIQTTELLTKTAQERYNPQMAGHILALETGYSSATGGIESDLALDALENAVIYALVVLSENPEKTAEKLTAELLDHGTAVRFVKLKNAKEKLAAEDIVTELSFMSNWSAEKVRKIAALPLNGGGIEPYPLYPEAEQLLNERGSASAFHVAAELYRNPSSAGIMKAERLRRAILNRILMQTKSPGSELTPELYVAFRRSRLFAAFVPDL